MEVDMMIKINDAELEEKYLNTVGKATDTSADGDDKSIIPKSFALQNYRQPKTARYLRYVEDDEKVDGFLQFSGKKLLSSESKLESEVSESNPKFVHISCSYNNKYWVRQSSDSNYIVAAATEKEEDQSKWSCTLYEPIYDADKKAYRFRHVQLGFELFQANSLDTYPDGLVAKEKAATNQEWEDSVFTRIIDWDLLYVFPRHVTLKGHNGKYLRYNGHYLQFSGTDLQHPSLIHEVFHENDGTVRIRNLGSKRFWIRDPNWIVATAEGGSGNDPNILFRPIKLGDNIVALRSMGNNHICTSFSADGKNNCLNADESVFTEKTKMEVSEAVISSTIENIEYRLEDVKIYGEKVWSMAKGDAINRTKAADTVQFTFTFEDKRKKNWTNTLATKFGVSKQFNAGVPTIGDGKVTVVAEFGGGYSWGESQKNKVLMSSSSTITVPPMSKVKMNVVVKRGFCDVPFSYTLANTLQDGTQTFQEYHDGVFIGVNSYDFQMKTDQEALPL